MGRTKKRILGAIIPFVMTALFITISFLEKTTEYAKSIEKVCCLLYTYPEHRRLVFANQHTFPSYDNEAAGLREQSRRLIVVFSRNVCYGGNVRKSERDSGTKSKVKYKNRGSGQK